MSNSRQGTDPATLERHFGTDEDLVPLWIAEPSVDLAPEVVEALKARVRRLLGSARTATGPPS